MRYFSGFSLEKESELFEFWLTKNEYSVAGFSYGAIKAFEYVLNSKKRVDRLILLSPAYFNDKSEAFKKMQLVYYKKNPYMYRENFLKNIANDSNTNIKKYISKDTSINDLKELLYYVWKDENFKVLKERGVTIEVILGESDKIINSTAAKLFFEKKAATYLIKDANHILRRAND